MAQYSGPPQAGRVRVGSVAAQICWRQEADWNASPSVVGELAKAAIKTGATAWARRHVTLGLGPKPMLIWNDAVRFIIWSPAGERAAKYFSMAS